MGTKVNEPKELFEYLNKKDINENTLHKKISQWGTKEIIDLYDEIFAKTTYAVSKEIFAGAKATNPFDFYASPLLSGGNFPCAGFDCRMGIADELSRFAVLYSDHALILHPLYDKKDDLRAKSASMTAANDSFRRDIETELRLLLYYRPLIEEGIIGITPHSFLVCKNCQQDALNGLKEIKKSASVIAEANVNNFKIHYGRDKYYDLPSVHIEGPEEFIPHALNYNLYKETKEFKRKDNKYWITKLIRSGFAGIFHPLWTKFSYLTNHIPDIEVLKKATNKRVPEINTSLFDGLSHNLPFIYDVPLLKLIQLRKKEGEAFQVYRDSLRLALKSVENTPGNRSNEAFNDIVLPELNKIENTIRNSKKLVTQNLSEDLLIGAGVIGLGLFAGLVSPTFGACLTAVGGVNFASGLIKQANHVFSEPSDIRDNGYYFLWKVRKESRNG